VSDHRFRFRSPERDRETDERRFGLIRTVVRSAIVDAEAEATGLRARIAEARRSAIFLVGQAGDGECAATSRAALTSRNERLRIIEQRLTRLEDDLVALRKLERRVHRIMDQPRVFALKPL
jgi:hypothetical protein